MADQSQDHAAIRATLNDQKKALYTKDADLLVKHNADDLVSFDLAPPLCLTGEMARDKSSIHAWFATWKGPIGREDHDVVVEIDGDLAFMRGLAHMTGTKTDGEEISLWFRSTSCFRRRGGKWQLVHLHNSVPFYMDGSYRAAIDLKP
jgi:ketosteroid isomerase-like protein